MCRVTDQFKLCSCRVEDLKNVQARWEWFRVRPENECVTISMGEIKGNQGIDFFEDHQNRISILHRLNEPDVFDFQPQLQNGDLLVLYFTSSGKEGYSLEYPFEFEDGEWLSSEKNVFDRENDFQMNRQGKIQDWQQKK